MVDLSSLKGMYDRYPEERAAYRAVIDAVEETAREFGFREIDVPSVERTELYRVKSGEELLDQTYSFEDRGGREVTLVPEQTPTRARLVQARKDLKTPIKWFDTSERWRYEQVQKGRDREFLQTDVDVFGVESVAADAEVVACAARIFDRLGVDDRVRLLINDRGLLEALLETVGLTGGDAEAAMRVIDDREKLTREGFLDRLEEQGIGRADAREVDALTDISGPIADTVADLAAELERYGVADACRLDLSIVRGLAYYTGLVFEAFDTEGELRALFGGGRYDDLVGLFGEQEVPAVGFAFGYSTTAKLLRRAGEWPAEALSTDVYVLPVSEGVRGRALEFATGLREVGLTVETDLTGRSVGSQFGYADGIEARRVVVVGETDLADGVVTVRAMDTGEEERVDVDRVVAELVADLG